LGKLVPAAGGGLTPRDAFFLDDVRGLVNKRLAADIQAAWDASGFSEYFAAKEKYQREHPGQEEADQQAYAAAHGGKRKPHVRDLPENWQRWMMTPDRPGPDFGATLRSVIDFERRVAAERKLEEQSRPRGLR
jgi:hypothetical protein